MGNCSSEEAINPREVDLSHFEMQRCVGRGGFGKVHAVTKLSQPYMGKMLAMKALEKEYIIETNMFDEVNRELNLLKTMKHECLCNGHYAFQDEHKLYLVMDLVEGGDMRVQLASRQKAKFKTYFKAPQIQYFMGHLALSIGYCHERLVLHRDIKPDNILLEKDGKLKLTDFGISHKLRSKDAICTNSSGTLEYMAPEIRKEGHKHSYPSDFYSIGIYLFELILLRLPEDDLPVVTLLKDAKVDGEKVTKDMLDFACKCLEPLPEDRFQTAADLKAHPFLASLDFDKWDSILPPFIPNSSGANVSDEARGQDVMDALGGGLEEKLPPIDPKFQLLFSNYAWNNELARNNSKRSLSIGRLASGARASIRISAGAMAKVAEKYKPEEMELAKGCVNKAPRSFKEKRRASEFRAKSLEDLHALDGKS
mmetsp:Transcript_7930/g.16553  ORF Transcript_7930/g.16553 Transcript_7930/m.16553 type:complete len:424 (+) Transcript_7930:204-1475(+)